MVVLANTCDSANHSGTVQMEVSKVMGVPPSDHPFDVGIFHETNHPARKGYPHDYGNPNILEKIIPLSNQAFMILAATVFMGFINEQT